MALYIRIMMNWATILHKEREKVYYKELIKVVDEKYNTTTVFPSKDKIFASFDLTPLDKVKVVILGQDPYHGRGQAQGLAFSTPSSVRNPPSMRNILKEIMDDYGLSICANGDLTSWTRQGILLLNTILTVEESKAKSHHKIGWEIFTDNIIKALSFECNNIVFILWGANAISKEKLIDESKHKVLTGVHPSPLSAYRGFFGCKHFTKTNKYLKQYGKEEIIW